MARAGRTARSRPDPELSRLLARWRAEYEVRIGRPMLGTDPVLCREVLGAARHGGPRRVDFGRPLQPRTYYHFVQLRARAAGLGHLSPHDLRRSAAGILHNARTSDGGHLFDPLDVQQVLDHADPATTQRSYIDPLTRHDAKDRASTTLD